MYNHDGLFLYAAFQFDRVCILMHLFDLLSPRYDCLEKKKKKKIRFSSSS